MCVIAVDLGGLACVNFWKRAGLKPAFILPQKSFEGYGDIKERVIVIELRLLNFLESHQ